MAAKPKEIESALYFCLMQPHNQQSACTVQTCPDSARVPVSATGMSVGPACKSVGVLFINLSATAATNVALLPICRVSRSIYPRLIYPPGSLNHPHLLIYPPQETWHTAARAQGHSARDPDLRFVLISLASLAKGGRSMCS